MIKFMCLLAFIISIIKAEEINYEWKTIDLNNSITCSAIGEGKNKELLLGGNDGKVFTFSNNLLAEKTPIPNSSSIFGMKIINNQYWIGSLDSILFKSNDLVNWESTALNGLPAKTSESFPVVFDFLETNSRIIIATYNPKSSLGKLYISKDKGITWDTVPVFQLIYPYKIVAINDSTYFMSGLTFSGGGAILKSSDFGLNWEIKFTYSTGINGLEYKDGNLLATATASKMFYSTDKGNLWENIGVDGDNELITAASFVTANTIVATSNLGKVYEYKDFGKSIKFLFSLNDVSANFSKLISNRIYLVSNNKIRYSDLTVSSVDANLNTNEKIIYSNNRFAFIGFNGKSTNLNIYNSMGDLIFTKTNFTFEDLPINNFAKGIYFLNFNIEERLVNYKFIVD